MLKKEIIWREILFQAIEKNNFESQQQILAKKFNFSLSTVFNALKAPRKIGAIEINGNGFKVSNIEKLLYLWGTHRKLKQDIIYQTFVNFPIEKIEAHLPAQMIWGSFSAYKFKFQNTPADYGQVYVYMTDVNEIKKRFPLQKGPTNLFILKPDQYLASYGPCGSLGQIFVDIWNSNEWYAQEFINRLKEKIL